MIENNKTYYGFSSMKDNELFLIYGGKKKSNTETQKAPDITPIIDSMIKYGDYYMDLGKSVTVLATYTGNVPAAEAGTITFLVGAAEKMLGLALKNGDGDVSKAMDRYYDHH